MDSTLVKYFNHEYYNHLWSAAQGEFRKIIADEKKIPEDGKEIPGSDRGPFMTWLINVYFQYMSAYKKFDDVYDQMVHPQKRPLVRQLLDLTLARLLEYREVMIGTELSDYLYYDEITHYYKWLPEEIDLPVPRYYYHERPPTVKAREELLEQLIESNEEENKTKLEEQLEAEKEAWFAKRVKTWRDDIVGYDTHSMILALQTVERQRQGLYKYAICQYGLDEEERERVRRKRAKALQDVDKTKAVLIIQKLVRGFLARRRVHKLRERELIFLGVYPGPLGPKDERMLAKIEYEEACEEIERSKERRRILQRTYQKNYATALEFFESKVRLLEAAEMAERMKFQIRKWLLDVKEKTGKLPDIPKAEFGGSKLIFCRNSLPPEILEKVEEFEKGKKNKKKKKKPQDKKKKKDKDKKKKKKKKKPLIPTALEHAPQLEDMIKANKFYNKEWRLRNELDNPEQKHEDEIIIREKRKQIGQEVRNEVDKLMRNELQRLKQVLEKKKGKGKKGKKGKKGGKGKGKGKGKGRKGKKKGKKGKKKKKRGKDLTKGQSLESLFEQLVQNGIIKKCPAVKLDELIGYGSIINESLRKYHAENQNPDPDTNERWPGGPNPLPTFGDIKRALKDICVLPMGSETIHQIAPFTKSVFIAGPKGSGKKSLVYAICNELGGTLFDLSPRNLVGKYPGKQGLAMLFHLLDKVGRDYCQPMIIMINPAEMQYMKKVPKTEQSEPKRIKKQLSKFIKGISADDRIMVFGLSCEPWAGKMKPMKKDYQKFIYIPKADHGDRLTMWRNALADHMTELDHTMNFQLLTQLTDSWTLGSIKECVRRALKKFQKQIKAEVEEKEKPFEFEPKAYLEGSLTFKPIKLGKTKITMDNFLAELQYIDPIFIEQEKVWNKWYNKTPLQKARLKFLAGGGDTKGKKGKKKGAGAAAKNKNDKKKKASRFSTQQNKVPLSPKDSVLGF